MDTTLTPERTKGSGTDFCVWEVPAKALSIRMRPEVAERLERESLESFRALTKRGSEIGGLLLGHVSGDPHAIVIEEIEAVSCDYSRGPLYLLSEADEARLKAAIARPRPSVAVVGFFRSNTRKELALSSDDLALAGKHFSGPDSLVLLVKPFSMKPSLGGWFLGEDGFASAPIEFTFRRGALVENRSLALPAATPTPPPAPLPDPPAVEPVVADLLLLNRAQLPLPVPAPVPLAEAPVMPDLRLLKQAQLPPPPTRRPKGWLWLPLLAGLIGGSSFFGYRVAGPGLPTLDPSAGALALKVERYAGQLRLSWNHSASAFATAQKATLSILDGPHEQILILDLDQLRTGSLVYAPATADVTFRLELADLARGKSVTESIRAILGRPSAFGQPALSLAEQPPAAAAPPAEAPPEVEEPGPAAAAPDATAPTEATPAEPAPAQTAPAPK
ncbi:MAG: hypothetical protein ACLQGV_16910 [Bryobacteraceae bacterium]